MIQTISTGEKHSLEAMYHIIAQTIQDGVPVFAVAHVNGGKVSLVVVDVDLDPEGYISVRDPNRGVFIPQQILIGQPEDTDTSASGFMDIHNPVSGSITTDLEPGPFTIDFNSDMVAFRGPVVQEDLDPEYTGSTDFEAEPVDVDTEAQYI